MSIKIQFLDIKNGGVEICAEDMLSYFSSSLVKGLNEVYHSKNGFNAIKICSSSEVWDFLTEKSLEFQSDKEVGENVKDFNAQVMSELFKFMNENREVFMESR